ncbi:MAG: hypothetical protein LBQ98_05015 [Nitrososphaerota archaeon]|jgi:hypothetical protein|nr:hypothetical protein [Nitrososphaerota archaeon]
MLATKKSFGSTNRLGKREKRILLLMLKRDNLPGHATLLWLGIYNEFKIDYSSLPKKYQSEYMEEKRCRCSIYRLVKRGFLKPLLVVQDFVLPDPRGSGYLFYYLTKSGRIAAKKIQQQNRGLTDPPDLKAVLSKLRDMGHIQVTTAQIHEVLWQHSLQNFATREEFDKYWNRTKLGLMLRKCMVGRARVGANDGRRLYRLQEVTLF